MKTALALGTFDGLHKGHREVLRLPDGCKKIAVIFPLPPKALITGKPLALMLPQDKETALKDLGIDEIFTLDFEKVRTMPPEDFLRFLTDKFSPDLISCGFNYRFGKNAAGDKNLLEDFCKERGITLKCSEPVTENGETVSSTEIRHFLQSGDTEKANRLLYKPFSYTAEVISGDKRGRTLGFPTVNQRYPQCLLPPKFGVYVSRVTVDGREYDGITDIGVRPTFKTDYIISETFIKGFSGDIYGDTVTVSPRRFVRGEVKFSSVSELKAQINADLKELEK